MAEITVTKDNFETEVLKAEKTVLLDFWAAWCGPCRMLSPEIAKLADRYEGKLIVGKINIDEEPELADAFHVESIPLLVVVKEGKAVRSSVGYRPAEQIEELLK